jgi:hypothetical protein
MPPSARPVPTFAAEPPQEPLPYGRWADTLRAELLAATLGLGEDIGEPGDIVWFPDRTYAGRTYVPATARTSTGLELFGYVSYAVADEPGEFTAVADVTEEVAESHPEWQIDLCDEVIGSWRGDQGGVAQMTLVWGVPLVDGAAVATAELGDRVRVTVDQCAVIENRFTLVAPDDYRGDTLEVRAWDGRGRQLAVESLYAEE